MSKKRLGEILANQHLRKNLAYEDPLWFCLIYLRHHFDDPFAPFHMEMFHLIKQTKRDFIAVMAFRGSGKSAIMNTANVLWSILGEPQKKFAVVVSQTQAQAKNHFETIKEELKRNDLLRADFGPFADREGEWKNMSLELEYHGSKIASISMEQSVRGMKYGALRPDLIICDDIESIAKAFEESAREETYRRFSSEILPLGGVGTRVIVLGNLICKDSLLMRLKGSIGDGGTGEIFRAYPIIDDEQRILWPGRFSDIESIKNLKKRFPREVWRREFLLKMLGSGIGNSDAPINVFSMFIKCEFTAPPLSYQPPLIPQMKEFRISVPFAQRMSVFLDTDKNDPEYLRYFGNVDLDGSENRELHAGLAKFAREIEANAERERGGKKWNED